jgi:hypothetical protein
MDKQQLENLAILNEWLMLRQPQIFPIFQVEDQCVEILNVRKRKVLAIDSKLRNGIIHVIENNLPNNSWQGFLYIMARIDNNESESSVFPLYVGKTGKTGIKNGTSANILNIRTNTSQFARWGHGDYWHIGQLSNSVFDQSKNLTCRHDQWAKELFETYNPPILKGIVHLVIINWFDNMTNLQGQISDLLSIEHCIIALARKGNPKLLNRKR